MARRAGEYAASALSESDPHPSTASFTERTGPGSVGHTASSPALAARKVHALSHPVTARNGHGSACDSNLEEPANSTMNAPRQSRHAR